MQLEQLHQSDDQPAVDCAKVVSRDPC